MPSTFTDLRFLRNLLALATLVACGAPGADTVFTKGNPKIPSADTTAIAANTKAIAASTAPWADFKLYRGYYRRLGGNSRFQPCGTNAPLEITGTGEGLYLLHERFRWISVEQGRKMFGVFQGTIFTDSAAGTSRTRFFITGVDSLRTWKESDCGGMKPGGR